jgi:hypothetical protein
MVALVSLFLEVLELLVVQTQEQVVVVVVILSHHQLEDVEVLVLLQFSIQMPVQLLQHSLVLATALQQHLDIEPISSMVLVPSHYHKEDNLKWLTLRN